MPAGEPVLGGGSGHGQLLGNDLENSDTGSGHARDCSPTPGQRTPGDRRSGARSARACATTAGTSTQTTPDVTYVPTHEGRITWDICPEPRHPPLRLLFPAIAGALLSRTAWLLKEDWAR